LLHPLFLWPQTLTPHHSFSSPSPSVAGGWS
jgi:hypothetical protein